MTSLDELRKQRLQGLGESNSLNAARERRRKEMESNQFNFTEAPKIQSAPPDTGSAAGEAFQRSAAVNILPMAGGIGTGAATGAALGSVAGPLGTIVGFIGGGIVGSIITKKAQDKVLEVTQGAEWKRNLDQSIVEDRKNHPYVTLLGEAAPQLIAFKLSPTTLKQAYNIAIRATTNPKSLATHTKTLQGKTELDALMNVAIGSGVDISLETYQQVREGNGPTLEGALRIVGAGILGGVISNPNRLGVKMGFKPSGDAVIEEYNKFGSQTDAARIITHGDIPIIDRSSDALFKDRQEVASIMRGQGEANRFTDPRILEAERIAGTVDKAVTPESDLNIYRLDGRDGPMRVGERVTANPHIADVYGGRINPEATVKAADLVRTSKGDYVYAPKNSIVEQPILPPVTKNVDNVVAKEVITKEKTAVKEAKAQEVEAIRLAGEPARLQKKAEIQYAKDTKANEMRAVKLEEQTKKVRAEKQKAITQEKTSIETQKQVINKTTDKQIEGVTTKLRKDVNQATLDHVKRLENTTTKLQKTKEMLRFGNQKAKLMAKAIKDKKTLRATAETSKKKITDNSKTIRTESDQKMKQIEEQVKELRKPLPKPTADVTAPVTKAKVSKSSETVKATESVKVAEPTTLIGTKVVESQSVIKNAIKDATDNSKLAQKLDPSITEQMGTTFIEQRKLSAEVVAEKGFDDALTYAREASDIELNKAGINRSALYETLYKTAIKEDQFVKYRDELEALAIKVSDEVSVAAQQSSLHRMATQNDPFRRVAAMRKALIENEKTARGSVFSKEVDDLYARLKTAGTLEDLSKIIKDNLC